MAGVKGRSGRRRKPNALHELAGNPGKRDLPPEIQMPVASEWDAPDYLIEDGLEEWNRVIPLLNACRVLTEADYQIAACYCLTVQEIAATAREGKPVKCSVLTQFRGLAGELGLTPASRSKVTPIKDTTENDLQFFAV